MLKKLVTDGFMKEESESLVRFFDDADEMIDYLENYKEEVLNVEDLKHLTK